MSLTNKKILLIIGGGISAYKSLDLIRILKKNNVSLKVVLTKNGKEFVTPLSISSLTNNKVYEDMFDTNNESEIDHISLSRWADIILVVPTTANLMTKLSVGKAEDLATTLILASNKDIILVPAMNVRMWLHQATQNNFKTLIGYGYKFIGPTTGEMACGEYGEGKMSSARQIFSYLKNYFNNKDLVKEKKITALVTTGPTREYIDPVRYISNESSGKQGYEIAKQMILSGAKVTLISGPTNLQAPFKSKLIKIKTAKEMLNAVKANSKVDIAIFTAAVSDVSPNKDFKRKIKKENLKNIILKKNKDILHEISSLKKNRPKVIIGFAAETNNHIKNARKKLLKKKCDAIVVNKIDKNNQVFGSDLNKVSFITKKTTLNFNKTSKINVAKKMIQLIYELQSIKI